MPEETTFLLCMYFNFTIDMSLSYPHTMFQKSKILKIAVAVLVFVIYTLLLTQPINLVTADLGRHIENGRLITQDNFSILDTNLYSYTYPDFKGINHHWLGGVLFFLIWRAAGFVGLHLVFILLSLLTLLIFFEIGRRQAGLVLSSALTLLIIPLLIERKEIRPEIFSYLLAAIFLWLMIGLRENRTTPRILWLLPILQIIWVNTHIYFFLGPVIVGAFWLESLILKTGKFKKLSWLLAGTALATVINPFGLSGALTPLFIFKNFGYRLAENQSVWFMQKFFPQPNYIIFEIVFGLVVLGIISAFLPRLKKPNSEKIFPATLIFAIGFSTAAWLAIRNLTLFGLFVLPILAECLKIMATKVNWAKFNLVLGGIAVVVFLSLVSGELRRLYPYGNFGLGLEPGNAAAAEFIKNQKISGPIFNNYDIGSYLTFYLYPQEKVFVDNRPEFYPADFFQKTYIPMQADENIWREKLKQYGFKTIVFSVADMTPWGQQFLATITKDNQWQTAFLDSRVIILVKN